MRFVAPIESGGLMRLEDPRRQTARLGRRARLAYEVGRLRLAIAQGATMSLVQSALAGGSFDGRVGLTGTAAAVLVWRGGDGAAAVPFGVAAAAAFAVLPGLLLGRPPCLLPPCELACLAAIATGSAAAASVIVMDAQRRQRPEFLLVAVSTVLGSIW